MNNKPIRITSNKLTYGGVTAFLFFILSTYLATRIFENFEDNLLRNLIIIVVSAIAIGVIISIIVKECYFKLTETGFEITKGKEVTQYDFSDFLGSNVVKHYTNGIYSGTTREIKIKDKNGKTKNINCNHISKEKFSEIVNNLSKNEFKSTHNEEAVSEFFNSERFFDVPDTELKKNYKNIFVLFLVLGLILLIPSIAFIILYANGTDSSLIIALMVFSLIATGYFLFEAILKFALYYELKTIPDHVSFDNMTLAVGKDTFVITDITNITMVPGNYTILGRDMTITTRDGKKHIYNFGKLQNNKKYDYKDYDELFKTTKLYCIDKNISFVSELG